MVSAELVNIYHAKVKEELEAKGFSGSIDTEEHYLALKEAESKWGHFLDED